MPGDQPFPPPPPPGTGRLGGPPRDSYTVHTVPKEIVFSQYSMKCSGQIAILRKEVHEVSCFPLHFILYHGNLDCFSSDSAQELSSRDSCTSFISRDNHTKMLRHKKYLHKKGKNLNRVSLLIRVQLVDFLPKREVKNLVTLTL